jgi:hypothetical protein
VVDSRNHRVQQFTKDGQVLAAWGRPGRGRDGFHTPWGLGLAPQGNVYVADWASHRLQVFAPDGTLRTSLVGDAQPMSPWAQTYMEANPDILKARRRVHLEPEWRFRRPVAVNVDAGGRIVVLEAARHRFQVYATLQEFEDAALNL